MSYTDPTNNPADRVMRALVADAAGELRAYAESLFVENDMHRRVEHERLMDKLNRLRDLAGGDAS